MLFGVFLAILVERKTPLTSTKGIERQKNNNNKCLSSDKDDTITKWLQNKIFCRFQEFNSDSA